ncbi:MAG TPA: CRTAC1 family protein [Candidatus Sulfotelmatobacter sp.]|nr:CRTAC1 family protein [Candidatus Sulfotelmatobacter sp.]
MNRREFAKLGAATALYCATPLRALPDPQEIFTECAKDAGIDFVHFNGMSGAHYYPEVMGSGVALFDYDNDGDLDIFLVQGATLGPQDISHATFRPQLPLRGRLYRNDSVRHPDGSCTLKFVDVTEESGIRATGFGMGVAAADFNNDGWVDIYITNFGHNQLWRNNGNGTFTDVTAESGADVLGWSCSAAFVDFDRDGWLDLFVCNYVDFRFSDPKTCLAPSGALDYCGPTAFKPLPNRLFRNRRDGTFEDVTSKSKIGTEFYGALGVLCADFNGDGWPDIFVTNDMRPNQLWINQRDGTFRNDALIAGCALNRDGGPQSSMGIDAGDMFGHGFEDLVITNLSGQYAYLYANDGKGWFEDRSFGSGLALATRRSTGFGVSMIDYDNDGFLDLLMVNGAVTMIEEQMRKNSPYPLAQANLLFHNNGKGQFENVTDRAGTSFSQLEVGRGAAFGDIDNDGDIDVVLVNNSGPARLLVNNVGHKRPWIGFRMVGDKFSRDMLGTRVAVFRRNAPTLWRRVHGDGSYCSSNDPRVLFGLGDGTDIIKVQAHWISGRVEEWTGLPLGKYTTLREGSGTNKS